MNKKYTTLAIAGLLALNTAAFALPALTADQEKARLATLWNLNANNALTIAQFVENGHPTSTIIDRDIVLLEKDMAQALQQKAWAEGFMLNKFYPGIFKSVAVTAGAIAAIATAFSGVETLAAYSVWSKDNSTPMSYANFLMATYKEDLMGMSPGVNSAKGRKHFNTLLDDNNPDKDYNSGALFAGVISPFVAVATLIFAGISKCAFNKNVSCNKEMVDCIKEVRERIQKNQTIIAQLKQLKYDNGL